MDKIYLVCQGNIYRSWNIVGCFESKGDAFRFARRYLPEMKKFHDGFRPGGWVCSPAGTTLVKWSNGEGFFLCLEEVNVCTIAAAGSIDNDGRNCDTELGAPNVTD